MQTAELLRNILHLQDPDGAFVYPVKGCNPNEPCIIETNVAACAMLGYSREEMLTLTPDRIITNFVELAGEDGGPFETGTEHIEHNLISKDGTVFPVEIRSHLLPMDDGDLNVVTVRDITRQIRSERKVEQDEQRFRTLYKLARKIDEEEQDILNYALEKSVSMTDSAIGYIYFMNSNETELTLHAWSKNVMQECSIKEYPDAYKVSETGLWGEAARQRKPIITNDYEYCPGKRGYPKGHVPIKRHMNLPVIDNGKIVLIAGVGNKEEEYTETDVVHLSLLMESVWRIIQRKRMENDIMEAMKTAEKANRAKSQFLANMSHELRTPLNGIMGMTQLLLGTQLNDEQKEYLTLSMEASLHLSKVMTSLLDLSSIETGAVSLTPINFNLYDTLDSLIKPLALQAAGKSLTLTHEVGPDVPAEINGDVDKLRQILINLIYNAIKFTEEGQVSLEVARTGTTTGLLGDMAELRFSVTDTGIGIPEDKQDAVFESFTLGEDYMTKRYGGTGLGLSISKELAHIMGGGISLKSNMGEGSTFTLTLPFLLRDAKGGSCVIADPSAGGQVQELNILLAEDEQVNALVTSGILKKKGHRVILAGNGQHAIDALMQTPFDLVLMDIQMPVVNGIQVTEIVRKGAAENVPRNIPIIGLTAYASDADRQRCYEAGMNAVVTKPFEASELLVAICNVMTG